MLMQYMVFGFRLSVLGDAYTVNRTPITENIICYPVVLFPKIPKP
jgi:hypothetical protein